MAVACLGSVSPMRERKSKVFSLRISPEEYRQLREACAARGVRSIGELARSAMHQMLGANPEQASMTDALHDLRRRVTELSADIERLSHRIPVNGDGNRI